MDKPGYLAVSCLNESDDLSGYFDTFSAAYQWVVQQPGVERYIKTHVFELGHVCVWSDKVGGLRNG